MTKMKPTVTTPIRQRDPTLLCGRQPGDQQVVQHRQPDAKQDDRVGKGAVSHERIVVVVFVLVVLFRQQQIQFGDLDFLPGRTPAAKYFRKKYRKKVK